MMPDGVAASFEARGLVATAAGGLTGVTTLVELSHLIASRRVRLRSYESLDGGPLYRV